MLISEIFHSIQGEGELTGVPSIFVRTSGCNLRCIWCDTDYASWSPEGEEMAVNDILEEVVRYNCEYCVLTGGEPMLAKEIHTLAAGLRAKGKHITIETAGTIAPNGIECDLASLSPKLANSRPDDRASAEWIERHERIRVQHDVLRDWVQSYRFQFKFVVMSESDIPEIRTLIGRIGAPIPHDRIMLMPEGVDPHTLAHRKEFIIDQCKTFGFRYCHRLHIDLFGNTKGT